MWLESLYKIKVFSAIIYSGQLSKFFFFLLHALYAGDSEEKVNQCV